MTPHDRLRISIASARYLEALKRDDYATIDALCEEAAADIELLNAILEIDAGLLEEERERAAKDVQLAVASALEQHMPSAEIVRSASGPATVADVAMELFYHTPDRLSAEAHQMNERLRSSREPLPENLGLPSLIAWAEAQFGTAPPEYWIVFREAVRKVRMRASADVEFQLAARRTKPRPEASS